jgi:hydrogenase/urease accessory protein HupE
MTRRLGQLLASLALLAGGLAQAHTSSTGLATIDAASDTPSYRLTLTPSELGAPADDVARGAAGDAASAARVAAWLHAHVGLAVDARPCRITRTRLQASQLGDERVVLRLDFACPAAPGKLTVTDRLSAHLGEHYRTIASVVRPDGSHEERVFDKDTRVAEFDFGAAAPSGWMGFFMLGIAHILSGWDHLLFLAALLVGSRRLKPLLITVTAFTLAHSLSLALSVLGWITLSPALVEPMIAASIVWIALENLFLGQAALRRYLLAFAFGLVHGLAFAEALRELHLQGWSLARALLGFNLGVEAGQALVVLALAPALAWAARHPAARRWERALSVVIGLVGLAWLVQRVAAG